MRVICLSCTGLPNKRLAFKNDKQMKVKDLKLNEKNPRYISEERMKKLVASIEDFPKMMHLRPIICDSGGVILGGNMRYRALVALGYKEIPDEWVRRAEDLTEEEKRQFIIKDNVPFGAWDMDMLANEWNEAELEGWGLDYDFINPDELGDDFELPDGDKSPFEQITFTLTAEQAEKVKEVLGEVKNGREFKSYTALSKENENSNGNALYVLAVGWNG